MTKLVSTLQMHISNDLGDFSICSDYGESMLMRLADAHPSAVSQLTYQYRMHNDICQLSNDIVYKGRLQCANDFVATRVLTLKGFPENLSPSISLDVDFWLHRAVDPSSAVCFLDTDLIKGVVSDKAGDSICRLERTSGRHTGGSVVNDTEVSMTRIFVNGLIACGVEPSSIGIISPFRAQIRLFEECSTLRTWQSAGMELSTIDRYQGRDKPVIVVSFVRSNTSGKVGRLLEDFRRLNVAITRAKCKLIMIGSYSTLYRGSDTLKPVLERIQSNRKVVALPPNAATTVLQPLAMLTNKT